MLSSQLFITNKISVRYTQRGIEKTIYLKPMWKIQSFVDLIRCRESGTYYSYVFINDEQQLAEVICTKDPIIVSKDVL